MTDFYEKLPCKIFRQQKSVSPAILPGWEWQRINLEASFEGCYLIFDYAALRGVFHVHVSGECHAWHFPISVDSPWLLGRRFISFWVLFSLPSDTTPFWWKHLVSLNVFPPSWHLLIPGKLHQPAPSHLCTLLLRCNGRGSKVLRMNCKLKKHKRQIAPSTLTCRHSGAAIGDENEDRRG